MNLFAICGIPILPSLFIVYLHVMLFFCVDCFHNKKKKNERNFIIKYECLLFYRGSKKQSNYQSYKTFNQIREVKLTINRQTDKHQL